MGEKKKKKSNDNNPNSDGNTTTNNISNSNVYDNKTGLKTSTDKTHSYNWW